MLESKPGRISFEGPPCLDYRTISCRLIFLTGITVVAFTLSIDRLIPQKLCMAALFLYLSAILAAFLLLYMARSKYVIDAHSGTITQYLFKILPKAVARTAEVKRVLLETLQGGMGDMKVMLQPALDEARAAKEKDAAVAEESGIPGEEEGAPGGEGPKKPADIVEVHRIVSLELAGGRLLKVCDTASLSGANSVAESICRLLKVGLFDASARLMDLQDGGEEGAPREGREFHHSEVQVPFYRRPLFNQPYGETLSRAGRIPYEISREEIELTTVFKVRPVYKNNAEAALYGVVIKMLRGWPGEVLGRLEEIVPLLVGFSFALMAGVLMVGGSLGLVGKKDFWPFFIILIPIVCLFSVAWLSQVIKTRPFSLSVSRDAITIKAEGKEPVTFALDEVLDLEVTPSWETSRLTVRTATGEYSLETALPYTKLTSMCDEIWRIAVSWKVDEEQCRESQ
ncbi:MAG: hypothetical protein RDV48_12895 [Candidatus Eremiobacteraeota bacterium]|nr:hypothetical protein [Candidatus Eremiobacteraeota bacterium]